MFDLAKYLLSAFYMPGVVLAAMIEISVGFITRGRNDYVRGETSVLRGRCFL